MDVIEAVKQQICAAGPSRITAAYIPTQFGFVLVKAHKYWKLQFRKELHSRGANINQIINERFL